MRDETRNSMAVDIHPRELWDQSALIFPAMLKIGRYIATRTGSLITLAVGKSDSASTAMRKPTPSWANWGSRSSRAWRS